MIAWTGYESDICKSHCDCLQGWPQIGKIDPGIAVSALALHSFSKAIEIPTPLRDQPLDSWPTSARLTNVLDRFGIRVLGDLHGRKVVDFAWEKNCGPKTLYELDLLARRARFQNGKTSGSRQRRCVSCTSHTLSNGHGAANKRENAVKMQEDAATFAIPESVHDLSFHELPITKRLANVVRSIGARRLGDLNGCNAFELLQYKSCGWRTVSEIQQLIERAVSGEFDVGQIHDATAVAELLTLLEQGLAKLSLRERQFVLARIGGEMGRPGRSRTDPLCLSYAEIGRRYGLTRARVQKVSAKSLDALKKIWGTRVPRLLEAIKWRCLSAICPLTPELLQKWLVPPGTRGYFNNFQLSMNAHLRLIALLDKNMPCWAEQRPLRIDDSIKQFDLALADVAREADGRISVAEAYRKLSRQTGRNGSPLTIENFLRMLRSIKCAVIEFKDPEMPIVRLSAWSNGKIRCTAGFREKQHTRD